jgi:tRNA G46 methylase TrmB
MPDLGLKRLVNRYQCTVHKRPIPRHTHLAFRQLEPVLRQASGNDVVLHLDSCCGVGASTVRWARQNPDAFVIGIDKSAHRLAKHHHYAQTGVCNYHLLRADCDALWSLLVKHGWFFQQHNLWYPNPWPKPTQRQRRWYAMPALAQLVRLQRHLSVRSNCLWYLEEFAWALRWWGVSPVIMPLRHDRVAMTPFEQKYAQAGQQLWHLACEF